MVQSRHSILMNAFRPAKEVEDPRFFAGRARQVTELTDALHQIGSTPLIYGDRGLGKTSLAIQMGYIATGDVELLNALGVEDRSFSVTDRYIAFVVTCTDSTRDFDGLVQLLINEAEKADFTRTRQSYKPKHLAEQATSFRVSAKIFTVEKTKRYEHEKTRPSYQSLSPIEKLQQLISIIVDIYDQPVLFIIDEVDTLQSTKGLASFIKATSSELVKFILVGIASSIANLLVDHQSISRSLIPVRVPLMDEGELEQIVENAQAYLDSQDIPMTFRYPAISGLTGSAAGFPWLVHVIGQSALLKAVDAGRDQVLGSDVLDAQLELPQNRFAQQYSNDYSKIALDSPQRETVLRAFATWFPEDIPTSRLYQILKSDLGVKSPSRYKADLASPAFGSVIYTPLGRHRREVRFADPIFKLYVRLTPSINEGVDSRVRSAFQTP